MHRHITGNSGELVDLFIELIDREPAADPHWWFNLGSLSGFHVDLYFPKEIDRATAMAHLRQRIEEILNSGLSEPFLIRHLKGDLDEWFATRGDTSVWDSHVDDMRRTMQDVIDDPAARARWREAMAVNRPEYANKTDAEVIADAQHALENSVTTRKASAEDAAQRWAEVDEWKRVSEELLPNLIFEHWTNLNIRRGLDAQRRNEG